MRISRDMFLIFVGLLAVSIGVRAKSKKPKAEPKEPQDEIEVVGHLVLMHGPIRRFVATQHYSSYYLYVEYAAGKDISLIDVTKASQPLLLGDVPYPSTGGDMSLFTVAGTAALVTEEPGTAPQLSQTQDVRVMDLSDPLHPKVTREFTGVTALSRDDRRGLIFLANSDGLWILHQSFALDPEAIRAYDKYVLYSH